MTENVKVNRIDGSNVYITINCFEGPSKTRQDNTLRIPIRRIKKTPMKGEYKKPIVRIYGIEWPSFVEYVSKHLNKSDK